MKSIKHYVHKHIDVSSGAWMIAMLSILTAPAAMAQDDQQFSLSLGVFITDRNTDTQINVAGQPGGTPVDLEADLGLDRSDSVFRIDGYYKFNAKHRIDFSLFDLSRIGSRTIAKEIDWNGTIYPIDTTIASDVDLNIYKLAYTWTFMQRDKGYLGVTGGLYIADMGARLTAPIIADRDGGGITAPLPVIGLRGEHHFSEKLTFRASGELFAFSYGHFDGTMFDLFAGIDYQIFDKASLGLGLNTVTFALGIDATDLNGEFDWRYDGAMIFLKYDF